MPRTDYIEYYEQGTGKLVRKVPIEISDQEIAEEEKERRRENILEQLDGLEACFGVCLSRIDKLEKARR